MKKIYYISLLIMVSVLMFHANGFAADAPHSTVEDVKCNSCHTLHAAPGTSLTNNAVNANLCISCHTSSGLAAAKPFTDAMQAIPKTSGTSHRWDRSMTAGADPLYLAAVGAGGVNNPYGLRTAAELSSSMLKTRLSQYSNVVTCSVCHNQHSQSRAPWDANAPVSGNGRHFMRIANDLNQLCEDCHYYRTPASGQTNVRTWDGSKKSHPVVKIFTNDVGRDVTDSGQFNNAPLEPPAGGIWAAQTGARYHLNGGTDANLTNNMVVGADKKIRCLSCHGMHYTDSNSATVDQP